jgi:hypothetical protein
LRSWKLVDIRIENKAIETPHAAAIAKQPLNKNARHRSTGEHFMKAGSSHFGTDCPNAEHLVKAGFVLSLPIEKFSERTSNVAR